MRKKIISILAIIGANMLLFSCNSKTASEEATSDSNHLAQEAVNDETDSRAFILGELSFIAPEGWENESSDTIITLHPPEDTNCSIVIYQGSGDSSETLDKNLQLAYAGLSTETWVTDFHSEDVRIDGQPAKTVTCRMAAEGQDELSKGYYFPAGNIIDYALFVANDNSYERYIDDFEAMIRTFTIPEHEFR